MNGATLDGFVLMLTGIASVLVFLSILVLSIFVMSKVVKKLNQIFPAVANENSGDDKGIIAGIVAMLKSK